MCDVDNSPLENFRPISGTTLFRSSDPHRLQADDLQYLSKMGIRTIIDFRCEEEAKAADRRLPLDELYQLVSVNRQGKTKSDMSHKDKEVSRHYYIDVMCPVFEQYFCQFSIKKKIGAAMTYFSDSFRGTTVAMDTMFLEMLKGGDDLVELNKKKLDRSGAPICFALRLLCEPYVSPALFCSRLGKDRTGLMSALIQSVCGVDRKVICEDYAKSESCLPKTLEELRPSLKEQDIGTDCLTSPSTNMEEVLTYIDTRYGSVSKYLESIGFTLEEQESLRRNVSMSSS